MKKELKELADHYGYEPQSRQLIEEMAELTINKCYRAHNYGIVPIDEGTDYYINRISRRNSRC